MITHKCKEIIDGFDIYAPDLLQASESYITDFHSTIAKYEENYFWFSERRRLICFLIGKYFSESNSFCEIGCGCGYILSEVKSVLPNADLYGTEIALEGLKIAQRRIPSAKCFQADILDFPYTEEFELIGAFDVLEHIEDEKALTEIHRALKSDGKAVISVPQHKWLWSQNDVYSCHMRRYSRKELEMKCRAAGFEVIRSVSYTSLLFPFFILNYLINRRVDAEKKHMIKQFEINPVINTLFKLTCRIELLLVRLGLNLPWGSSLTCIIRKK